MTARCSPELSPISARPASSAEADYSAPASSAPSSSSAQLVGLGWCYDNAPTALAMQLLGVGELNEARRIFTEQLARALERGDAWSEYCMRAHLSEVERFAGDWERAHALAAEAHALERQIWEGRTQSSLFHCAIVRAQLGHVEAAREAAAKGIEQASRANDRHWEANNRWVLGFLELSLGNVQAAAEVLPPLVEQLRGFGVGEPSELLPIPDALEVLVAVGRLDEAEAMACELLATGERLDRAWALASRVARPCARLRGSGRARGGAGLGRASSPRARPPRPAVRAGPDVARQGVDPAAGEAKGEAKQTLGEALAIFERLPAPLWAAKAREEIRRIGLRPRATATSRRRRRRWPRWSRPAARTARSRTSSSCR